MLYSTVPFKRTHDGLEAIKMVKDRFPCLNVVFFGSEFPEIPLIEDSKFFRRPSQEKIRSIYLSTRIWISPSLVEGFCLPALEAISLGCAVVATDSLGIQDIITDGKEGLLVEPGNPKELAKTIIRVLENRELERRLQLAGLKKSQQFSWEASADKLEDYINGISLLS